MQITIDVRLRPVFLVVRLFGWPTAVARCLGIERRSSLRPRRGGLPPAHPRYLFESQCNPVGSIVGAGRLKIGLRAHFGSFECLDKDAAGFVAGNFHGSIGGGRQSCFELIDQSRPSTLSGHLIVNWPILARGVAQPTTCSA